MHSAFKFRVVSVIIGLLIGLLTNSCDPWQPITFKNDTQVSIKVETRGVPLDFAGTPPSFSYGAQVEPIEAGKSKEFLTSVPNGRSTGAMRKYSIVAVNERNEVVFSKVFTWDELHDAGWKVVITAQK